jgi:hypothetical protein
MVVEDYFTKWTEAIPIPNAEATTVARKFVERIVTVFGVPLSIHCVKMQDNIASFYTKNISF